MLKKSVHGFHKYTEYKTKGMNQKMKTSTKKGQWEADFIGKTFS